MNNFDERIAQCKNDIAKLQENLKALEAEKNKPVYTPRNGDYGRLGTVPCIVEYEHYNDKKGFFITVANERYHYNFTEIDCKNFVLLGNIFDDMNKGKKHE